MGKNNLKKLEDESKNWRAIKKFLKNEILGRNEKNLYESI